MNVFDFIVTVGLGSAFGRVVMDPEQSLAEGITAFILLTGLDIESAVRHHGKDTMDDVEAVVLEASGHFAVILKSDSRGELIEKLTNTGLSLSRMWNQQHAHAAEPSRL